jgi:hypothetical protein
MAFFDFPLADLLQDCEGAGPLNKRLTVLQNDFPVNFDRWPSVDQKLDLRWTHRRP